MHVAAEGDIYPETDGFAITIQATNNYKKIILKDTNVEDRCRKCGKSNDTIAHIINGCGEIVSERYKKGTMMWQK